VELQLEKAGVRLAHLLNVNPVSSVVGQTPEPNAHAALSNGNTDARLWVNTKSGAHHCPGTKWYYHLDSALLRTNGF
jgi:hypothetical protein